MDEKIRCFEIICCAAEAAKQTESQKCTVLNKKYTYFVRMHAAGDTMLIHLTATTCLTATTLKPPGLHLATS